MSIADESIVETAELAVVEGAEQSAGNTQDSSSRSSRLSNPQVSLCIPPGHHAPPCSVHSTRPLCSTMLRAFRQTTTLHHAPHNSTRPPHSTMLRAFHQATTLHHAEDWLTLLRCDEETPPQTKT